MRPRIVLFDIDNTLLNSGGAGRRALERAVLEVTGVAAELGRVPFAGRTDPAILRDLLAVCETALSREGGTAGHPLLRNGSGGFLLPPRELCVPERLAAIFDRYVAHLEREVGDGAGGRLLPGVRDLLDALAGRPDLHLGVLTGNIARGARIKMRPYGLVERFRFGAFGDDADTRPQLLPVALARSPVRCDVRDVYVIGDTVHDIAVARAHGARAVAVGTGGRYVDRAELVAAGPDWFFEDLSAAAPLLRELSRDE